LYIPEYNRVKDTATAVAFMKANPFAIVVSAEGGSLFASHIPVLVCEVGDRLVLRAHIARANNHGRLLQQQQETLVIFHGPHAYVSPRLYESRQSVPTWNYAVVHAYGHAEVFSEPERLKDVLAQTILAFDPGYLEQWSNLNDKARAKMLSQITGLEMPVTRLEAKFKLSQNRSQADQARVIEAFQSSADSAVAGIATLMKERG
jgi:transcriptional regulator